MVSGYIPILVMLILATAIAFVMVIGSALLGPKKPTVRKRSTYECGMTPVGSARERFPVKFYLVAMLFIIFDIETIFLYPWAVTFGSSVRSVKLFNLAEMAVFVAILFVGYFYMLGRGALDWDEGRGDQPARSGVDRAMLAPRPPIQFGNEDSGPVALPQDTSRSDQPVAAGKA
jgi:NADH-quinone oxidoreductase subunit A